MRCTRILLCFTVIGFVVISARAQSSEAYIPQVGNGTFAGGSVRTTFLLVNSSANVVTVNLRFTDDDGQPFTVAIPSLGTDDQFGPLQLMPGENRILQTDGSGSLKAGAARVLSSDVIGISAIFTLYDSLNKLVTEAGVGASELQTSFTIPVETTSGFNTGLALFNPGSADASVTFTLLNLEGGPVDTRTETIRAGRHRAQYLADAAGLFPQHFNFLGTLAISSTQPLSTVALRQNRTRLSNTTLPVVSNQDGRTQFNLPQVANGFDPSSGTRMKTTFIVFNNSPSGGDVSFSLKKPDGTPFPVTIPGGQANGAANFIRHLAPGASAFLETDGSGPLSVGSAQVSSTVPIGISAIFKLFDPSGASLTEAGVGDSQLSSLFTLPVEIAGDMDTGVAFFNPSAAPVTIRVRLVDVTGLELARTAPLVLNAGGQKAVFASELFPGRPEFRGTLGVEASAGVAAVTLRQNAVPLSYTTLPVSQGFSPRAIPPAPKLALLDDARTNVNLSSKTTLDLTLNDGYKVTGRVRLVSIVPLPLTAEAVAAKNDAGEIFPGTLTNGDLGTTDSYAVVVPAGTYSLSLCRIERPEDAATLKTVFVDPNPIKVQATTARNISVPLVIRRQMSGTVTGLDRLPANQGVTLALRADDGSAGYYKLLSAEGTYAAQLPAGNYTASLVLGFGDATTTTNLFNLGSVPLSGSPILADFDVPPTAQLSGAIRPATPGPIPDAFVIASDTSAPGAGAAVFPCNVPAPDSRTSVSMSDGLYHMVLTGGRSYLVAAVIPVLSGELRVPSQITGSLQPDSVLDFDIPSLPGGAVLSGRVADSAGHGLLGVRVSVVPTAGSPLDFRAESLTDSSGNYALTVLKGHYDVFFTPPKPLR